MVENQNSLEKKLRIRVLVYSDDLPINHLRNKGGVTAIPRVSMSAPKNLTEKVTNKRRSREEGKPREKGIIITGRATVGQVIEKAIHKFGINEGIVDDGKPILETDDGKLRYNLMMIIDGKEKYLHPDTNMSTIYNTNTQSDFRHFSVNSLDSTSSLTFDYNPDEPMFVLRLLRSEDYQKRSMSTLSDSKNTPSDKHISNILNENNRNNNNNDDVDSNNNNDDNNNNDNNSDDGILSRKQLIEKQREYSRAKQKSILGSHKNEEQGVDIITSIGAIRSSRIFGSPKVRYSFISNDGKGIDISDLIENIWADEDEELINVNKELKKDELANEQPKLSDNFNMDNINDINNINNGNNSNNNNKTQEVDILEKIINRTNENDYNEGDEIEMQSIENRINRVIQKVKTGQYSMKSTPSITNVIRNKQNAEDRREIIQQPPNQTTTTTTTRIPMSTKRLSFKKNNTGLEVNQQISVNKQQQSSLTSRPISIESSKSEGSIMTSTPTQESYTQLRRMSLSPSSSIPSSSIAGSDWLLSDEFGLQELLIFVRAGINKLDSKERRTSEWFLNDDRDNILEQFKPDEIRDEIKDVFANVNDKLDKLELELDQIMNDAVRAF